MLFGNLHNVLILQHRPLDVVLFQLPRVTERGVCLENNTCNDVIMTSSYIQISDNLCHMANNVRVPKDRL